MSTICARCTHCGGTVGLEPEEVVLAFVDTAHGVPPEAEDSQAELLFDCPVCGSAAVQLLPRQLVAVLLHAGVAALRHDGHWDVHLPHPERPPAGARFQPDDLLDLHELLSTPDWVTRLGLRADPPATGEG